jgi:hypothetical protein
MCLCDHIIANFAHQALQINEAVLTFFHWQMYRYVNAYNVQHIDSSIVHTQRTVLLNRSILQVKVW